jgi:hypothetical protein
VYLLLVLPSRLKVSFDFRMVVLRHSYYRYDHGIDGGRLMFLLERGGSCIVLLVLAGSDINHEIQINIVNIRLLSEFHG